MKLGIVSDSHDNLLNVKKAVIQAEKKGAEKIIHCGDLVSPFVLDEFDSFSGEFHFIIGNNPGDIQFIMEKCNEQKGKFFFHGQFGKLKIGKKNIAFVHEPYFAYPIFKSGDFDMLFYGHTHLWDHQVINDKILLNPGELLGKKGAPSWALVDTENLKIDRMFF
jgi:putative phosphoesterase